MVEIKAGADRLFLDGHTLTGPDHLAPLIRRYLKHPPPGSGSDPDPEMSLARWLAAKCRGQVVDRPTPPSTYQPESITINGVTYKHPHPIY